MNEVEVQVVTLEDGKDYIVLDTINDYIYLQQEDDPQFVCVRKIIVEDSKEYLVGLSGEDEYNKAILEYTKIHKGELKDLV